jgi:hypothetical protein
MLLASESPEPTIPAVQKGSTAEYSAALDALGRVLDTPEFKAATNSQVTACQLLYRMNSLHADDRYRLLKSWTLPNKDRETIRMFSGVLPDAPPPRVFLQESLPPIDEPMVSTAILLIDAAREAGKIQELAAELRPMVDRNVPGAEYLDQLVFLVNQRGANVRLRQSAMFDEAELDRQLKDSQRTANFTGVLSGYRAKALAVIERTGSTQKPSPDPGLKHWVPVDLCTAANMNQFSSTSWWIATDDHIGHVCSPWVDHLVFAYPLEGTFQISCDAYNGFWSEGNVGFGGLMFEVWNQGSRSSQIYPINGHESLVGAKPTEFRDKFNRVAIDVAPSYLKATGNNDELFEDLSPSATSPFLVLRTTWLSAFRDIRIQGKPVIPREVSLLASRRMEGWVTSFYNESQPPEVSVRHGKPGATRSNDPTFYDWSTIDNALHGRRFPDLNSPHRRSGHQRGESWVYYHRPLREGDRIRYEFLYQPGDAGIAVHPTLDRVAFLLQPDGVKLHWLTTNRTDKQDVGWVATDNQVDEPANRRGPSPLPLKPNEWNAAAVEIRNGRVRLELNGELVYERPLEANWGSRFGFYHDRTKTSAQIRKVVLSGNWPEWTAELGANLLERSKPITPTDADAIREILAPRLTAK